MNWRRRRTGPQVELVQYTRSGQLKRRTATLYPPTPPPPVDLDQTTSFDELDAELERYAASLARVRAELKLDRENPPLWLTPPDTTGEAA